LSQPLVFTAFKLPNGQVIKNRIVKAAMEENMSDPSLQPGDSLVNLYQQWAEGGAGLILTGNVMVDRLAMTGPGGVVLENTRSLKSLLAGQPRQKRMTPGFGCRLTTLGARCIKEWVARFTPPPMSL
jgi:2,4-dienoyl-CoA reductase-like NADH-dependent reductase (Old Yellow Enzyme family)